MSDAPKLILDADGVFMSERPYWNAALATALEVSELAPLARGRWDALADYAFGPLGVQRVTKGRGCNSNWDLATVLVRALQDHDWRAVVREMLEADREYDAMQALGHAADAVRRRALAADAGNGDDPLARFGIDRKGELFRDVVGRFQQIMNGEVAIEWDFERWQLKEPVELTLRALDALASLGFSLRVCTGRHRAEIEEPVRRLGLGSFFPPDSITSGDEVDRAEARTGRRHLGKPHWFSPACAALGFEPALAALGDGTPIGNAPGSVYVGDAWADYAAVLACRDRGLELAYVHSRSGVTTREQEQEIARSPAVLAVVDRLGSVAGVVKERES
jgi:phosphoglycolate phosphatase-like HAD superfamily hydrolase